MNCKFKETLKKEDTKVYQCAICGKYHPSIMERAQCEIKCTEKLEEEAKLAAEKKKAEEQAERKKAVDEAWAKAYKLENEYVDDYGSYTYCHHCADDGDEFVGLFSRDFLNMLP